MKKTIMRIFQTIARPFLKQGVGKLPIIRSVASLLTVLLTPLSIDGDKFYCPPEEGIDYIFGTSYNSRKEFLKKEIKKGDVVLDLGANAGFITLLFAKLVANQGKVYPFEAYPSSFEYLKKNIYENGYRNVFLEGGSKAVSDKNGEILKIYIYESSRHNKSYGIQTGQEYIEVETIKLDDIFGYFDNRKGKKIDFVHMDIVGGEVKALKGMISILKNNPGIKIFLDFSPDRIKRRGSIPIEGLMTLKELGFRIWRMENQELFLIEHIEDLIADDKTKALFCKR